MLGYRQDQFYLIGVDEKRLASNAVRLKFHTTRGDFTAIARLGRGMQRGVIMLGGPSGGFGGPGGLYAQLSESLYRRGIASMRLDFRIPGDCVQASIDTLLALQYLDDEAVRDVVLLGWSFGGAVAMAAGAVARNVCGIVALATCDLTCCCLKRPISKPALLIHGDADRVAPVEIARRIKADAFSECRLVIYPGIGHSFIGARERLQDDLLSWIGDVLSVRTAAA